MRREGKSVKPVKKAQLAVLIQSPEQDGGLDYLRIQQRVGFEDVVEGELPCTQLG